MQLLLVRHGLPLRSEPGQGSDRTATRGVGKVSDLSGGEQPGSLNRTVTCRSISPLSRSVPRTPKSGPGWRRAICPAQSTRMRFARGYGRGVQPRRGDQRRATRNSGDRAPVVVSHRLRVGDPAVVFPVRAAHRRGGQQPCGICCSAISAIEAPLRASSPRDATGRAAPCRRAR